MAATAVGGVPRVIYQIYRVVLRQQRQRVLAILEAIIHEKKKKNFPMSGFPLRRIAILGVPFLPSPMKTLHDVSDYQPGRSSLETLEDVFVAPR